MKNKVHLADRLDSYAGSIDFRRKFSSEESELISMRAEHLEDQDRLIVLSMFREGKRATEIGRLINQDPRAVRRKIKNALARIEHPMFSFVVLNIDRWGRTRARIAKSLYIAGYSIRHTSEHLDIKLHTVRRHKTAIQEQFYAMKAQRNGSSSSHVDRSWR